MVGKVPRIFLLVAEHGYWYRGDDTNNEWIELAPPGTAEHVRVERYRVTDLEQYMEATDGSFIQAKGSSFVWHYRVADADFGNWQAKELVDHLEGALEATRWMFAEGTTSLKLQHRTSANA